MKQKIDWREKRSKQKKKMKRLFDFGLREHEKFRLRTRETFFFLINSLFQIQMKKKREGKLQNSHSLIYLAASYPSACSLSRVDT